MICDQIIRLNRDVTQAVLSRPANQLSICLSAAEARLYSPGSPEGKPLAGAWQPLSTKALRRLAATVLSFLFVRVLAPKDGFTNPPSEASLLCDLLSGLFEIVHDSPADRGVSLRFCGLLLVLRELLGMLPHKFRIELFAVGLLFHELRLKGAVHCIMPSVRVHSL
jgi:hypothetical protein